MWLHIWWHCHIEEPAYGGTGYQGVCENNSGYALEFSIPHDDYLYNPEQTITLIPLATDTRPVKPLEMVSNNKMCGRP